MSKIFPIFDALVKDGEINNAQCEIYKQLFAEIMENFADCIGKIRNIKNFDVLCDAFYELHYTPEKVFPKDREYGDSAHLVFCSGNPNAPSIFNSAPINEKKEVCQFTQGDSPEFKRINQFWMKVLKQPYPYEKILSKIGVFLDYTLKLYLENSFTTKCFEKEE